MLSLATGGALAATFFALALPPSPASAGPFTKTYVLPPVASAPETLVALVATDDVLLYGSAAEDEPGAASLFRATTGALRGSLPNPLPEPSDDFARAVAISDRLIAIGSQRPEAVHLYDRRGVLLRTIPNPSSEWTGFGLAVGLAGSTVAVGAPDSANGGEGAGAVFLFDARDGHLIRAIDGSAGSNLGAAVAGLASQILAGAPGSAPNEGAAGFVVALDAKSGHEQWRTSAPTPSAGDRFGAAIATWRDRLLVGAPYGDVDGTDAGAAYALRSKDGAIVQAFHNPTRQPDRFGSAVALGGGLAAIGAPAADGTETDTGLAYVFSGTGRLIQTFDPDPLLYCGNAGTAVAVGTDFVAVGTRDCFGDAYVTTYTTRGPRLVHNPALPRVAR